MTEEPLPNPTTQWLWFLLIASLGVLLILWLIANWQVDSDVKRGASPDGLTFPANPGLEVSGNPQGGQGEPAAE